MRYEYHRNDDGSLTATAFPESHLDRLELDQHPWIPGSAFNKPDGRRPHVCGTECGAQGRCTEVVVNEEDGSQQFCKYMVGDHPFVDGVIVHEAYKVRLP